MTFRILFLILFANWNLYSSNANAIKGRDKKAFKISVFYDDTYENVEDLTSYSVDVVNRILKTSSFQFEYTITKVDLFSSYKLTKTMCNELNEGRIAIISIGDCPVFSYIQSIANSLKIPYLSIKWENYNHHGENNNNNSANNDLIHANEDYIEYSSNLNIHPPANKLIEAIIDLISYYKWEFITILYQESLGPHRIEDLIRLPANLNTVFNENKFRLQVRQLSSDVENWIYLIKDVKLSGSSHIIVDIENKHLNRFLQLADEVGLMTAYFHIIFTTLDLSVLDYGPSANITGLQVFEPNDANVKAVNAEFNLKQIVSHKPLFKFMPSIAAFIYDAFSLIANTIDKYNLVDLMQSSSIVSCQKETSWLFGSTLTRYLRMNKFNGLTGNIEFDPVSGLRTNLTLNIVDRTKTSVDLLGYWKENTVPPQNPIEIVRSYAKEKDKVYSKLNRTLIVTTKIEAPYVMRRVPVGNETLTGNDQYKGYCVDLLDKIALICNFTYKLKLVEDGFHGAFVNGKWNGIVGELIDKKADLSAAALTISFQREQVIDFTKPFLNLGISILYKRPLKKTPNLFSFLSPLSIEIWLYMLAAHLLVSLMLFVLARFSPYEWQNPHPCSPNSGIVENQFTLSNSMWFTIGSLMQQGTDISPKSPSVRLVSCAWGFFTLILISSYTANLAAFLTVQRWFFALILISSYTANLAAFLTAKRLTTPIENAEGLAKQESKIQTYQRMWNFMSNNPDVFVKSTDEGIARIKKGGYAYLLESTTNEYMRQRDCELIQIGGLLDTKGYGIGTPSGSPWRDQISNAILQLQENGELQELYTKWWEKEDIVANAKCDSIDDKKKDSASELSFAQVGGVFAVLAVGLCLSFIVALIEFSWKAKKTSDKKTPFSVNFKAGFKNIMNNFFKPEFEDVFAKKKKTNPKRENLKGSDDELEEEDDDNLLHSAHKHNKRKLVNYANNNHTHALSTNNSNKANVKWKNQEILDRKAIQDSKVTSF